MLTPLSNDICSLALAAAEDHGIGFAVFCRFVIKRYIFWAPNVSRSLGVSCSLSFLAFMPGIHVDTDVPLLIATIQLVCRQAAMTAVHLMAGLTARSGLTSPLWVHQSR